MQSCRRLNLFSRKARIFAKITDCYRKSNGMQIISDLKDTLLMEIK